MPYDETLAGRIRTILEGLPGLSEMLAFGGISFLINGNMACGVIGEELIARIGPAQHATALEYPGVHTFDFTGRPMKGWITISPPGFSGKELDRWVMMSVVFAQSLPPKVK